MRQPHALPPSSLEYPTLTRSALATAEGAATLLAPCLAILAPAARIAWASRARSSVGRAPPSHGGGHEFESRRVHSENPLRTRIAAYLVPGLVVVIRRIS